MEGCTEFGQIRHITDGMQRSKYCETSISQDKSICFLSKCVQILSSKLDQRSILWIWPKKTGTLKPLVNLIDLVKIAILDYTPFWNTPIYSNSTYQIKLVIIHIYIYIYIQLHIYTYIISHDLSHITSQFSSGCLPPYIRGLKHPFEATANAWGSHWRCLFHLFRLPHGGAHMAHIASRYSYVYNIYV